MSISNLCMTKEEGRSVPPHPHRWTLNIPNPNFNIYQMLRTIKIQHISDSRQVGVFGEYIIL